MLDPASLRDLATLQQAQQREQQLAALPPVPGFGQVSRNRARSRWRSVAKVAVDRVVRRELRSWVDRGIRGLWADCAYHGYVPTLPAELSAIADYLRSQGCEVHLRPAGGAT